VNDISNFIVYLHAKACENGRRLSNSSELDCIWLAPSLQQIFNVTLMSTQVMQKTIADYFKTQPVLKAWLFGSFARGEETPRSDVDILFVPDRSGKPFTLFTHGGMLMDLQELLGRKVDLVEEGSLRPYAAESANRDKILIYERKSEG
jgi:predicted nucleotidyltransferase